MQHRSLASARQVCGRPRGLVVRAQAGSLSRRDLILSGTAASLVLPRAGTASAESLPSAYDFSALMYGEENVNYPGLRTLYEKYKGDGFTLCAFPCNQFGGQAPGTSEEERAWAFRKFGFEFDVYDKIDVNGPSAHPLYKFLRSRQPASAPSDVRSNTSGAIEWNYVKFMVDRNGQPVKRYKPSFDPLDFESDVRLVLAGKAPLPGECILHPGRKVCKVERYLQES